MSAPLPPPLLTKLIPLRPPADVIDRPRLRQQMASAGQVRLTLVVAPGGFGKSTLAAHWLSGWRALSWPVAWLSLDAEDDEPLRFVHYLAHAAHRLHPEVGLTVLSLLDNKLLTEPRALVTLLINDLAAKVGEAALVVDDYHWVQDPAVHELMAQFLTHVPDGLHLLIATRSQPPLPLGRLRALGQCLDVGTADLRFDAEETASFLAAAPAAPSNFQQVEMLQASTEGWPAALRIAKRSRRLHPPAGQDTAAPAPAPWSFSFLLDDALSQLPAQTLAFMAQTAVLDRLEARVCNAVTGGSDAHEHLHRLVQGALLVELLDEPGHPLRYHDLLREHLLGPVAQRLGLDLYALHRRAAHWYAAQQQWADAVEHALSAGDSETGLAWLADSCLDMAQRGDLPTLLHWRRRFPEALMRGRTELQLALAWGLVLAMRTAEAAELIQQLEDTADTLADGSARALRAQTQVLWAGVQAVSDLPLQALARLAGCDIRLLDDWTAESMTNVLRYSLWQTGRWQEALDASSGRPLEAENPQSALWLIYREAICSRIWFECCNMGMAEEHAREAQRLYELHGTERSSFRAIGAPLLAMVLYEKGQFTEAESLIARTQELIDNSAMLDCVLLAALARARSARALGRGAQGHEILERGLAVGRLRGWPRIQGALLLERLEWLGREGRLEAAAACLAELAALEPGEPLPPDGTHADLPHSQGFGQALWACFEGRFAAACDRLTLLLQAAQGAGKTYRATVVGLWLAQAQSAHGQPAAAHATLEAALRQARAGGLRQTVLDAAGFVPNAEGQPPIAPLLRRFLAHPRCDKALAAWIQSLLGPAFPASPSGAAEAAASLAAAIGAHQPLTPRELEVLALAELGLSTKEIARRLSITPETVKTHFAKVFQKLEADNRAQAVRSARLLGLMAPR